MVDPKTGKAVRTETDSTDKRPKEQPPVQSSNDAKKQKTASRSAQGVSRPPAGQHKAAQSSVKQQLVMTVAVGGVPAGKLEAVQSLAAAVGKVCSHISGDLSVKGSAGYKCVISVNMCECQDLSISTQKKLVLLDSFLSKF